MDNGTANLNKNYPICLLEGVPEITLNVLGDFGGAISGTFLGYQ